MYIAVMTILMCFRRHDCSEASKFHLPLSVALFATFSACSMKFAYHKRRMFRKLGNEATSRSGFSTIRLASPKHG